MKKSILKTAVMLLSAVMLQNTAAYAAEYSDVPASHWAYSNIEYISELGIVSGYDDGTYRPDANVTRAEWAKMLCSVIQTRSISDMWLRSELMQSGDLTANDWSAKYMMAVKGYLSYYRNRSDGLYYYFPDRAATREEVATSIVRILGYTIDENDYSALSDYTDVGDIDESVKKYVNADVKYGIISGYDDGTIRAGNPVTRAEAAVLMQKLIGRAVGMNGYTNVLNI